MSTRTPARPAKRPPARKSARASGRVPTQPHPLVDPSQDADPHRDPALYLNRELSQLDFNFRVLAHAQDAAVPLLERLRYLCIS